MNQYEVTVNGSRWTTKASKTSVAVKHVLDRFKESEVTSAHIEVRRIGKVAYAYRVDAYVPDGSGARSRQFVSPEIYRNRADAQVMARELQDLHSDWHFVSVVRVEAPPPGQ